MLWALRWLVSPIIATSLKDIPTPRKCINIFSFSLYQSQVADQSPLSWVRESQDSHDCSTYSSLGISLAEALSNLRCLSLFRLKLVYLARSPCVSSVQYHKDFRVPICTSSGTSARFLKPYTTGYLLFNSSRCQPDSNSQRRRSSNGRTESNFTI